MPSKTSTRKSGEPAAVTPHSVVVRDGAQDAAEAPEPPARARTAAKPQAQGGRVSTLDAAKQVLQAAGGPLHVSELTEKILALPGVSLGGKTPKQTIVGALVTATKKPDAAFVRTAPSTYDLKDRG